jgi:hypothetical protein
MNHHPRPQFDISILGSSHQSDAQSTTNHFYSINTVYNWIKENTYGTYGTYGTYRTYPNMVMTKMNDIVAYLKQK